MSDDKQKYAAIKDLEGLVVGGNNKYVEQAHNILKDKELW